MSNSNAMCAHLWAQQDKARGQSSNGNLSFLGDTLYSYNTPIGCFVETKQGRAVLVTSHRYSVTTSGKHMPALWRALDRDREQIFVVPNLGTSASDHAANLAHLVAQYDNLIAALQRKRELPTWRRDYLMEAAEAVRGYVAAFGLKLKREFNPPADWAAIEAFHAERAAKRDTPAYCAKRERERIRREAAEARKAELARAESAERLAAWRAGESVRLQWGEGRNENGGALLRVRGEQLETSMGARVPLPDAIRVYRFVKLCKERGEAWQANGQTLPVGHFQVQHVAPNGTFRAGCHLIHWPEIEAAAKAAGVSNAAPAGISLRKAKELGQ